MDNIISICHENKIHQFACELEHTTNEERKDKLRTILYQLKNDQTEQPLNKARKELDNMCIKMTENQFKKTWNISENDFVFGFSGRLIFTKGWRGFAEAFLSAGLLRRRHTLQQHLPFCIWRISAFPL